MREIAILTFITLDGVMQGPGSAEEDPSGAFERGGWAAPYWPDVMAQVMREAMAQPYDMLFGRKTYEIFAGYWPHAGDDDPVAVIMNGAKKYVATNSLTELRWNRSIAISGDIVSGVRTLKAQDGPLIQIHGSGELIRALLAADLIDEFRLWTFPVVLGAGRRLFDGGASPSRLALEKTEPCSNGVVMSVYRRA